MSVEAPHETEIDVVVEPVALSAPGSEGAVVSPPPLQALVAAVSAARAEVLPAASYAATSSGYDVPHVSPEKV